MLDVLQVLVDLNKISAAACPAFNGSNHPVDDSDFFTESQVLTQVLTFFLRKHFGIVDDNGIRIMG